MSDIELTLYTNLSQTSAPKGIDLVIEERDGRIVFRRSHVKCKESLSELTVSFIREVENVDPKACEFSSTIQVGVFHSISDALSFTFRLSSGALSVLASKSVSMELVAYPCSD